MRERLRFILAVGVAAGCCGASEVSLSIPPLQASQPVVSKLVAWDGGLAAETDWGESLFYAPFDADQFRELHVRGCDRVLSVSTARSRPLALCKRGGTLRVVDRYRSETDDGMSVPIAAPARQARMAASEERVAIATSDSIVVYSPDAGWRAVHIPERHDGIWPPPTHLSFGQGYLWMGWNVGESGGGLYRLDLGQKGSLLPPVMVRDINVLGIENGLAGEIWVASGASHLGVRRGLLLRIEGGEVVDEPFDFQGLREGPSFGALTLSTEGTPVLVDNYMGILEARGGKLRPLVRGQFVVSHETTWTTDDGESVPAIGWYGPTDAVASPDGRYFLSTDGLGVLELSGSNVRQMLFR